MEKYDLSQEFIGIIMLPIIGNAAEHYTAITVAMRNKMDLALGGRLRDTGLFDIPGLAILGLRMIPKATVIKHDSTIMNYVSSVNNIDIKNRHQTPLATITTVVNHH